MSDLVLDEETYGESIINQPTGSQRIAYQQQNQLKQAQIRVKINRNKQQQYT